MGKEGIMVLLQRRDLSSFLFSVFIYFLLITVDIVYKIDASTHIQLFVKCLPLFLLIVYVCQVQGFFFNEIKYSSEGFKILLGLILSTMGDGMLVYQNVDTNYFITGAALFLLAQIVYMNAFQWKKFDFPTLSMCLFFVFATIYGIFVVLDVTLKPSLQYVTFFYTLVIYLMAWRSWARINIMQEKNDILHVYAAIGSLSFVVSDTLLAINKFAFPVRGASYTIMATYYIAQFFIAISTPESSIAANIKKKTN